MRLKIITIALVMAILSGCASPKPLPQVPEGRAAKIFYGTDLHLLSPKLTDNSDHFQEMLRKGDGKLTQYSDEITHAFLDEVLEAKPDALILGGDLTFNGEEMSHTDLAEYLAPVKNAGLPVLIIPGNHDINQLFSYRFVQNDAIPVSAISQKEFWQIYSPFGGVSSISRDKNSLSYVCELSPKLRVLMLDTSQYQLGDIRVGGKVSDKTLAWVEKCLQEAQASGAEVLSVTHHNLLIHSRLFFENYTIADNQRVVDLYKKYNVRLNLSGHMHIQHIADQDGFYDIATNSMAVSPNHYAEVTYGDEIVYHAKSVDVAGWAKKQNISDENLLNFSKFSADYFRSVSGDKVASMFLDLELPPDEEKELMEFTRVLNSNYFAGTVGLIKEDIKKTPAYAMWQNMSSDMFFGGYIDSMLSEKERDNRQLTIPAK